MLFHNEITQIPGIWCAFCSWLAFQGVIFKQHKTRCIIATLANIIYEEADDRSAVDEMAQLIIANRSQRCVQHSSSSTTTGNSQRFTISIDKVAHNISMRFKNAENKFSREIVERWVEFVEEYRRVTNAYGLNEEQKINDVHNIIRKESRRFYIGRVKGYASNFYHAVNLIETEYNSFVHQNLLENYPNALFVSNLNKATTDTAAALVKVYKAILNLTRQVPISHRGDANRV